MKKPRLFLSLVLILLVINAIFFIMWYGFDLQGKMKNLVEKEVGKILSGTLKIETLSITDRQVIIQNISFAEENDTFAFEVPELRVRYNLLKLLTSRFDLASGIQHITITKPYIEYNYKKREGRSSSKSGGGLPDFSRFFGGLEVVDGSGRVTVTVATSSSDTLYVLEDIRNLNATVKNTDKSQISLSAVLGTQGILKAEAILDKGAISNVKADLKGFNPTLAQHPLFSGFHSEITAIATLTQENADAPIVLDYNALIWDTGAKFLGYDIRIPFISANGSTDDVAAEFSQLFVNESSFSGAFSIIDFSTDTSFDAKLLLKSVDLSEITDSLSGFVRGEVIASGSFDAPLASATLYSDAVSYGAYKLENINIKADYADELVSYQLLNATWEQQNISSSGTFDTYLLDLEGKLNIVSDTARDAETFAEADIDYRIGFYGAYPNAQLMINHLYAKYKGFDSGDISGSVMLASLQHGEEIQNYLAEVKLSSSHGLDIDVVGDILDQTVSARLNFMDLYPADIAHHPTLKYYNPVLGGEILLIMSDNNVTGKTDLHLLTNPPIPAADASVSDQNDMPRLEIDSQIKSIFSYHLKKQLGSISFDASQTEFNHQALSLSFFATYAENVLNLVNFSFNDMLYASGSLNTKDLQDFSFDVLANAISSADIEKYLSFTDVKLPFFENVNLTASYNTEDQQEISAKLFIDNFTLDPIKPISAGLIFSGNVKKLLITGYVRERLKNLLYFDGFTSILPKVNLDLIATTRDLALKDFLVTSPLDASFNSYMHIQYDDVLGGMEGLRFSLDLDSKNIKYDEYTIDSLRVSMMQEAELFSVEELNVYAKGLLSLSGKGALDYNFFSNTYFDGEEELQINLEAETFKWLKKNVDYIEDAKGKANLEVLLSTQDDTFVIKNGSIKIDNGMLHLKDQIDPMTDIRLIADIESNKFIIRDFSFDMGMGRMSISNYFETEPSDHFMVGALDLGIFQIRTSSGGILLAIPLYTPPQTLSKIVIKGRDSEYLVVKGPFDNMKIKGDALISSASVVYPPKTDNLLKMVNTFRESAMGKVSSSKSSDKKKNDSSVDDDPVPLPFILDVKIIVQDNLRYVTYPLNMEISSNSFLHLMYDGQEFKVNEANFSSDSGTIDFFGTVFQVDYVSVIIIDAQDLMNIGGVFYKRAADGTMITLNVSTPHNPDKDLLSRLEFNLSSDNPADRSISHIISRLRYNEPIEDLSPEQRNSLLQDDAVNLISQNLNSSILTPFLYPVENQIRRFLRLDSFSLRAGFIQNLVNEYATDSAQVASYVDFKRGDSELAQFSSSILLNNLSLSMSKYLGRKLFIDYELSLQEATDLSKKTKLLVSHDTSLRMLLPWRLRIAYTLHYEATESNLTHEVMLQRNFRF